MVNKDLLKVRAALHTRQKAKEATQFKEVVRSAGYLLTSYAYGFHASLRPEIVGAALLIWSGLNTRAKMEKHTGTDHKRTLQRLIKADLARSNGDGSYTLTDAGNLIVNHLFTCLERGTPSKSVLLQKFISTKDAFRVTMWPRYFEYYDAERLHIKKVHEIRGSLNLDNQQDKK
jgi:hypothetical protein